MFFTGKRILITGSARRCGAALVRRFAGMGATMLIHCCNSRAEAEALCASLPGGSHEVFTADLLQAGAAAKLFSACGRVDVLINNASIFFRPGSPEDLAAEENYMRLHYHAPMELLQLFAAQQLPGSCAVNILDQAVLSPGSGAYYTSRKMLADATLQLAKAWGTQDIRINGVAPGPMLPPSWAPDSKMAKTLPTLALRRPVAVEDFTSAVEFLITNNSVTGAIIPVDCGQHLQMR